MAQVTNPSVVIVAHGSPCDPEPQEAALAALAAQVDAALPDITVTSATLAKPRSFETTIKPLDAPLLYPFFMADGYFVRRILAEKAAAHDLAVLRPFGHEPALAASIETALSDHMSRHGLHRSQTTLLVAAHGSSVSQKNAETAKSITAHLRKALGFKSARCGFIEQPPFLEDVARDIGQAICLPFFALRAGHYEDDLPAALKIADFSGTVLPPFIEWSHTADLITKSLARQLSRTKAST